jgi:hypothetical protein
MGAESGRFNEMAQTKGSPLPPLQAFEACRCHQKRPSLCNGQLQEYEGKRKEPQQKGERLSTGIGFWQQKYSPKEE